MLDFKKELSMYNLDEKNSVVIGSGLLNSLGIRESEDIDAVLEEETFDNLKKNATLIEKENQYGAQLLTNGVVEFSNRWYIDFLGIDLSFEDLIRQSTVIDGVRYVDLELLLEIKKLWAREKDLRDVELIENYLERNR